MSRPSSHEARTARSLLLPSAVAMAVAASTAAIVTNSFDVSKELRPVAAVAPAATGVYTLASGSSGKCIEVHGSSKANGAGLVQAACTSGATRQQWRAEAVSGRLRLVNVNSGLCFDLPNGKAHRGLQYRQWTCNTATAQQWTFPASKAASGKYQMISAASGRCVTNKDGSTAGGNPIVQQVCADIASMQWRITRVTASTPPPSAEKPVVAADGSGAYRTVQAAINAVPANNKTRRVITIKPGTYREIVTVNKPYVTLRGLGSSASKTVIVNNRSAYTSGTSGSYTALVSARDAAAENLTISNDLDESTIPSGHQAVALRLDGDRTALANVRILGDQDTLLVNDSARAYVKNSYVEGTVDFIFGGGTIVFHGCDIREKRTTGGPITAASTAANKKYGFLFYRSNITGATANTTQLGRPWRQDAQVLFRESTLSSTIRTSQPWTDMSSNQWKKARFLEYRNTGPGATANGNRPQLPASQAADYTPQKYLAGTDGWNPVS